ncbi:MAG: hypothetical protein M1820_001364 [Bogoriella megaspora]|nr:MAG: hypothetical protein M1820_001364 [Bogoriella megaspora]
MSSNPVEDDEECSPKSRPLSAETFHSCTFDDEMEEPQAPGLPSQNQSPSPSRDQEKPRKEKKRVVFTPGGESVDEKNQKSKFNIVDKSQPPARLNPGDESWQGSSSNPFSRQGDMPNDSVGNHPVRKLKPTDRRGSSLDQFTDPEKDDVQRNLNAVSRQLTESSSRQAYEAAKKLEADESGSVPGSMRSSFESPPFRSYRGVDDVPLMNMGEDDVQPLHRSHTLAEAQRLVKTHRSNSIPSHDTDEVIPSGYATPVEEQREVDDYVPRPARYRGGILSQLMKLYNQDGRRHSGHLGSATSTPGTSPRPSPPTSGTSTPLKSFRNWYSGHRSSESTPPLLGKLVEGSASLGAPAQADLGQEVAKRLKQQRPPQRRSKSNNALDYALKKMGKGGRSRLDHHIRITIHISEVIQRQRYLLKLCRALMQYGAPTHRLEEYMTMSARVLEIEGQFLYIPGCMIISFDDPATHTTEVKIVRVGQAVDLGKLSDIHDIYKLVVHDQIDAKEGYDQLQEVLKRKQKHPNWLLVPTYGFAAAAVGPFAFGARIIDLPIAFLLGSILGILQLIAAPRSDTYANVFEISAAALTSFLARAFGSIKGGDVFCFSALAQSSIALILPGYIVLCGSLELQSKAIVAGSVRIVYAIIYALFLGLGITIGTAVYGVFDHNANSEATCRDPPQGYLIFLSVPCFTLCLCIINQAKWKQTPVMLIIAFAGYIINYFTSKRFPGNSQVSQTLAAFAIGVMANLYSRLGGHVRNLSLDFWELKLRPRVRSLLQKKPTLMRQPTIEEPEPKAGRSHRRSVGYGLAAASMLPAIFVQVPSGLSVGGSLVSGIASADQITNGTMWNNGSAVASSAEDPGPLNSTVFSVGYSVIQVAVGIACGLFFSALAVYPFGKKRSALFSF